MPFSLHAAVVPSFLKMLGSVEGLLDKAQAHASDNRAAPDELLGARLADDMHPFAYQVKSTVVHSIGAIEGVRCGAFSPDESEPGQSFAALVEHVGQAKASLAAISPKEVDDFVGRPMRFEFGRHYADFVAEDFLLHFSLPNFYFHATTAYDLLRMKGLNIGKVDYLGRLSFKKM